MFYIPLYVKILVYFRRRVSLRIGSLIIRIYGVVIMKYSVFEQIVDGVVHGNGTIGIAGRSNIYVVGDGFILKIVEAPAKWISLIQRWLDDPDIFVGKEFIDDIVQKYNKIFIKYIERMTVGEWASRIGYFAANRE